MTLLTICHGAADAIGIQRPSTIIGNTNDDARTLLVFAQEELESLRRAFDWPALIREGELEVTQDMIDFQIKRCALSQYFDRFTANTLWDRQERRPVDFPNSSRNWAYWKGMDLIYPSLNRRARMSFGNVYGTGGPATEVAVEFLEPFTQADVGKTFYHEWITQLAIQGPSSGYVTAWQHDDDEPLLPAHIIRLGIVWRYKAAKGLMAYAKDEQKYRLELEKAKAASRSSASLQMAPHRRDGLRWSGMVSDHGYG